ncbi:MAG: hypothetical protein KTQ12_03590 [Dermatophilaceae bacterium]|nr:hypothetical protein [Dermatophilaceae bacterium]
MTASRAAELSAAVGAKARADRVAALRDGRKERAAKFTPKRGRGSYQRRPKHNRRSYR